jgi:hypothetical protein
MNEPSPRAVLIERLLIAFVAIAALVLLFGRLWSFGIWDPWELSAADAARHIIAGDAEPSTTPTLSASLVATGFRLFDVHEWSGRLPIAIAGLFTLLVAFATVARSVDRRAGIYAVIVVVSTPLFLFNARQMIGAAPEFLGSALVFFCAFNAVFASDDRTRVLAVLGTAVSICIATLASGVMLGAAPPLLAVAGLLVARRHELTGGPLPRRIVAIALVAVGVLALLMVVRAIDQNAETYSAWIGGAPHAGTPPTFEVALERVFHSFAPWSAVLPIAIGSLAVTAARPSGEAIDDDALTAPARDEESALAGGLVLWAGIGLAAETVFESRYGAATYLPVVALGGIIAIFLRRVERDGRGSWAAGLVTLMLAVLLIRDFRGYPGVPASGLGLTDLVAPEVFNPGGRWAIVLLAFGGLGFLGLSSDRTESFAGFWAAGAEDAPGGSPAGRVALASLKLGVPLDLVRTQWRRGLGFRLWTLLVGLLVAGCVGFGVLSWGVGEERDFQALGIAGIVLVVVTLAVGIGAIVLAFRGSDSRRWMTPWLTATGLLCGGFAIGSLILSSPGISSLGVRVGEALAFVPVGVVLAIGGGRTLRYGFHALGEVALFPMLAAALACGAYASLSFEPELSTHFSPREVYDTYNALAGDGEPLGEYRVGGRAAAYYAEGHVEEVADENAALDFLARPDRVWLAFRADDLAALDRAYRHRSQHHLFVADARSARILLATNQPISGRADENYLRDAILDAPPDLDVAVHCNFDQRVELVGYDLETPGAGSVGPGQLFTITWYWRAIAPVPAGYQIFLHVDGYGQRLNGDHEPVDGHYPVRLWDEGDIVVDRQELRVPANFPAGQYAFNIGFYSGETRLEILEGPEDEVNRCIAGRLMVR